MYHIYTQVHYTHSLIPGKQTSKETWPPWCSQSPQKRWKTENSSVTFYSWSTKAGLHNKLHITGNVSAILYLKFLQTSLTSITSCYLLHPSQQLVLIPSLNRHFSLGEILQHAHSLNKEPPARESPLTLSSWNKEQRICYIFLLWLYLPWVPLLHMDHLSAGFLLLMIFKEDLLIIVMPLATCSMILFGLPCYV